MAAVPLPMHVRAVFDGKVFVPEQPIDLPKGTVLDGWATPERSSWPEGYIEGTMGQWVDDEMIEPVDLPPPAEETLTDLSA